MLFCDLVGFTPLSEVRDPEEVRDLLSGYFDLARSIVSRYGGVIQKFIGDAVMAVWGAPLANEDDAERAVRAGLDLVSAVSAYGTERGIELAARVGIVTGGAATTETAEEGLVIGDRVNTAARVQSVAAPGSCYVDETTRAATAAAIAYTDVGDHELKGKAEPLHLYEATRVIAAVAGSQRSGVLEAPFTGRDHELRLVKELFHASAERNSARLVLVSGVAGVGKSRLAWEFFKYIDGLAGDALWHTGRCLSYGEGVSYWALSEMVRARLRISEEDPQDVVAERLRTGLERWIPDPADREYISPRLGQLLGLPTQHVLAREELFSGWRLFFERLSEHLPVIMVVEDLQWADAGMVDFLDHLLEWSGDHALFLLVLTRPEGTDKQGLVLTRRNVTNASLDPLSDELIGELLDGLVANLPAPARHRIVERAEGIPLYAVETVRSLLDRGVVAKAADGELHLVQEIGILEIPPGLTALIASRLDALQPEERRVVKECSVLGSSFSRQAIEAVTDSDAADLDDILSTLVRKEILTVRADKLSPERGQYAFTQSLIRSVAYDMLSKAERRARHLRTAAHLRRSFPDEGAEVAEVIAAHLHDAYLTASDDADADELRSDAQRAYVAAAERAESVGAPEGAEAAYVMAAKLSLDEREQADLTERAGRSADLAGLRQRAVGHFEATIAAHSAAGRADRCRPRDLATRWRAQFAGARRAGGGAPTRGARFAAGRRGSARGGGGPAGVARDGPAVLRSQHRSHRAHRAGTDAFSALRASRDPVPCPLLPGCAAVVARPARRGAAEHRGQPRRRPGTWPDKVGDDRRGQPGRRLHDPRPTRGRGALPGDDRARPALGGAIERGVGLGQPHVRPDDGRTIRRGIPHRDRRAAVELRGHYGSSLAALAPCSRRCTPGPAGGCTPASHALPGSVVERRGAITGCLRSVRKCRRAGRRSGWGGPRGCVARHRRSEWRRTAAVERVRSPCFPERH